MQSKKGHTIAKMPSAKPETIPLWRKYLTVEPAVFLYFYGLLMLFPVEGIYIYQRVSDMKGFPYQNISQGGGGGCGREEESETNSSLWQLEEEAQTLTSNIFLGYNLVLTILSLFVAPLWGPWTDKGGKRKPALQVAILGACLELSITLLVMYLELSVYILFVAAAVSGLSGFATVLLIGASSYIADISSEEERAFRLAILYLQIFFAGVISQMTSGLWIDNVGFIPSAWFILFCFILAGVWTLFCLPETPRSTNGVVPHFFSLENIKSFLNFFRKERQSGRKNIFLPLTCAGVVHLVTIGVAGVLTLFLLKSPLCWGPTLVGYYFAFAMFVHGVGSVAGVNYFGRCFTDLTVFRIGMVTLILSSILLAFSSRTWMIFVAGAVGIFNGVPEPILQSGMSRIVGEDEQGVLFSTYGVITALTQLVGAVLFNSVYQASLSTFKGLVFILCAVLVIIPFVLLSFVELPPAEDSTNEATEAHELEKSDTQNQILNVAEESMENEQRNTAV